MKIIIYINPQLIFIDLYWLSFSLLYMCCLPHLWMIICHVFIFIYVYILRANFAYANCHFIIRIKKKWKKKLLARSLLITNITRQIRCDYHFNPFFRRAYLLQYHCIKYFLFSWSLYNVWLNKNKHQSLILIRIIDILLLYNGTKWSIAFYLWFSIFLTFSVYVIKWKKISQRRKINIIIY